MGPHPGFVKDGEGPFHVSLVFLVVGICSPSHFVFLNGSRELIESRLNAREDHYMPPSLLDSQFADLEAPADAMSVEIDQSPEEIVREIRKRMSL